MRVRSVGPGPMAVGRSDFNLSAAGDVFAAQSWSARRSRIEIAPGSSRDLRVTFGVARAALEHGSLVYRDRGVSRTLPLGRSRAVGDRPIARGSAPPIIRTFPITQGVGEPWDTAVDSAGNIWFAEPGCDFAPTCPRGTPPGQIGKFEPSTGAFTYYPLPNVAGNQPIFLAFDGSGNLWFTTPNNDMIGEFSPASGNFVGQWPVAPGSGPWDLTFANGQVWYTEHLVSAVGRFDPGTHAHQDFPTPSANSNPYGITASGSQIWFTENNSSVDRVAVLDTARNNTIAEYPIVQPFDGTPHLIVMGASGQPWWTEGWSNTIATLNPAVATPGSCGHASGPCNGIQRFHVPPSSTCGGSTHTSGIAFEAASNRVWLDNSLTAQVGSFTPSTGGFAMNTLSNCNAHPHDGLNLDAAGNVWFDEEFANALGELVGVASPAPAGGGTSSTTVGGVLPAAQTSANTSLAPANTAVPAIRGTPRQGRTLTALNGSWANGPTQFSYRWQRCAPGCANIDGATGEAYRLTARDIDAKVRVVVTAGNAAGIAAASSRGVGPIGPSLKRVKGALAALLAASTRGWTIHKLLARGGSSGAFHAPSHGRLRIAWRARPALMARAHRRFAKAGAAHVAIHLTGSGRSLLKRVARLRLAAEVTFTPAGEAAVTSRKRFTLRGGQ